MRAVSVNSRAADSFDGLDAFDLAAARRLFGFDPIDRDLLFLSNTGSFDGLACCDFRFLNRAAAGDVSARSFFLLDAGRCSYLAGRDVGLFQRLRSADFKRPGGEFGGDPFGGERRFAGNARGFGSLRRGNLFLFNRTIARNLAPTDFLLERNALVGDDALLCNTRAFGGFPRGDLGVLQIAGPLNLEPPVFLVHGDARRRDRELLCDASLFGLLAGSNLGLLDVARPFDLAPLVVLLAGDPCLGDYAFLRDAGAFDPLARGDFCLIDLAAAIDLALADVALGNDPCFR